jgi:hypothetical protein
VSRPRRTTPVPHAVWHALVERGRVDEAVSVLNRRAATLDRLADRRSRNRIVHLRVP